MYIRMFCLHMHKNICLSFYFVIETKHSNINFKGKKIYFGSLWVSVYDQVAQRQGTVVEGTAEKKQSIAKQAGGHVATKSSLPFPFTWGSNLLGSATHIQSQSSVSSKSIPPHTEL